MRDRYRWQRGGIFPYLYIYNIHLLEISDCIIVSILHLLLPYYSEPICIIGINQRMFLTKNGRLDPRHAVI